MAFDLSTLNSEQIKPVLDTEGAVLVTAGAGSGKTRLLTHRIAHLIVDKGVDPYNILAITFTNKAANEMKERLENMVSGARGMWVSTFHSMCSAFLRKYIDKLGYSKNFSIYSETEKERSIKKILKAGESEDDNKEDNILKLAMHAISEAKNEGLTPEQYYANNNYADNAEKIRDVYIKYEKELRDNNALDFDDLLNKAYELLLKVDEAAEYYKERFKYIHVDEFQDTNTIQYKIVKLLASKYKNILIVGDEDQSIYGWRGANISNIYNFTQDFSAKFYKLEQNYRSSKKILNLANKIIEVNSSRIKKILWTDNESGENIETYIAPSESNEAEYVVNKISSLVRYDNYNYSDFAILMRLNALTRPFEEKLIQYGIPHKIFGGFKFYERKEIKDIMAYLRITVNPQDNEAILRVINFPKRGIGDAAILQLQNYSQIKNIPLIDAITGSDAKNDLPPAIAKKIEPFAAVLNCLTEQKNVIKHSELIKYLIRLLNLKEVFAADTEENENRKQNIKELINAVGQFETLNPDATLEDYMQNVALYSDLEEMSDENNCVNIATVHSAKGLEFKAVFIIGLEDGIFPISRSFEKTSEMEEERRLMYVAITRAMDKLFLTYSATRFLYNERKSSIPSRFLGELGYNTPKRESSYNNYNSSKWYNKTDSASQFSSGNNQYSSALPPSSAPKKQSVSLDKFKTGMTVSHKKFGIGTIMSVSGEEENLYGEIEFESVGKLVLSLNYAPLEVIEQ